MTNPELYVYDFVPGMLEYSLFGFSYVSIILVNPICS